MSKQYNNVNVFGGLTANTTTIRDISFIGPSVTNLGIDAEGNVMSGSTSPFRLEEVCGKYYCVTTINNLDYAVEIGLLVTPETPMCIGSYLLNNMVNTISATTLLSSIPAGAISYSLSNDSGTTWTTPNGNPALSVINMGCSGFTNGFGSISVKVVNDCGENICSTTIESKAPTIVCLNGLAVELQPGGPTGCEITLFPNDILQYVDYYGYTGGTEGLSISKDGITFSPSVIFDCNDIGTQNIFLGATNCAGRFDYCATSVSIQNNMCSCI